VIRPVAFPPRIQAVGRAFPRHYCEQPEVTALLERHWAPALAGEVRLRSLHRNTRVKGRYLALPLDAYTRFDSFAEANEQYVRCAVEIGEAAARDALDQAKLRPEDVDHVFFVSTTGVATPSIDARLFNRMGLDPHVKRTPLFGLGCAGGAAGIARASDYLRAYPDQTALVVSVELCSLTLQPSDTSVPNLIATGLFGDGAAAVVLAGGEHPAGTKGPAVVAGRSVLYPGTERVMGWDVSDHGFKIVLSADVPRVVSENLRRDAEAFLAGHELSLEDLGSFVCHPGGPRVIEALKEALDLTDQALSLTWDTLERYGNVSSVSVLLVLRETLRERPPPQGSYGLLLAMGPGFCSELVLLRW